MDEGIYHLEVRTISRSQGRSAPAAAAYRSATVQTDERTGETFDYRRKRGVLYSAIVLPKLAPKECRKRSTLWHLAESSETRINSVVAREIIIALPFELSLAAQIALVQTFVDEIVAKHGVAIDFNLHAPHDAESKNVHAHLQMSTRRLCESGFDGKTREWDDKRGPNIVKYWRGRWAELMNEAYAHSGIEKYVDHRSHKDRNLEIQPGIKMGVAATGMERRGRVSERGEVNRAIATANDAILKAQKSAEQGAQARMQSPATGPATAPTTTAASPQAHDAVESSDSLPMPSYIGASLASVYLLGPSTSSPQIAAGSRNGTVDEQVRQEEEEYRRLCALHEQAKSFGRSYDELQDANDAFLAAKRELHACTPPEFSRARRFLGLNKSWDAYIDAKDELAVKAKAKQLALEAVHARRISLRAAQEQWDKVGYFRHRELRKLLGYEHTVPIAYRRECPFSPVIQLNIELHPH